jgi:putative intracellular protease/amidase
MQDQDAGEILRYFHQHSKPTAMLCHGLMTLVLGTEQAM